MVIQHNALPDCTLSALRFGEFPPEMRRPFLREAARACARYVRGGGNPGAINPETSHLRQGHLILLPLPPGTKAMPSRTAVENGLLTLESQWAPLGLGDADRLRFFLGFCEALAKEDPLWLSWSRLWLTQRERALMRHTRARHREFLTRPEAPPPADGVYGTWLGNAETDAAGLLHAIRHLPAEEKIPLKEGPRATVWAATLMGENVVIKYFEPNPRAWRRRLGYSRARHAWAGSRLMQSVSLRVPEVLGFVECYERGAPKEGYVVHRRISDTEPFGLWLLRRFPGMKPAARDLLRHRLREELLKLYRLGIYHKDTKTHNLLVRELPGGALRFWWIDLEDIRATGGVAFWKVVRNLYQLNSSVPNRVRVRKRVAFARGLRSRFPLAVHPLTLRYIEAKSRRRLLREVRSRTRS
ncbi:MAG: hypothetical protein JJU05_09635 [Verrucomicrobia bacterium]|nr:hypothetical protein [Verrucomicrobiota bacterium]MCH8525988.1 lipopolysaccharide kinase InaA family protein [Kiritimatiellia bacterium]